MLKKLRDRLDATGIPTRTIIMVIVLLLLAVVGLAVIRSMTSPRTDLVTQPADTLPPGQFRPTKGQWASLKIAPVVARSFHTETVTEGKIALDDDLTSPVFSPYSGRVVRVMSKAGDLVKRGQPLFAIEASEFVQGQNDLTVALANVTATRTQLDVAQTIEKRQHALYDAKAAALKDWQQSQADLAMAVSNAGAATVALSAVRNRLRILGKSESEITSLEHVPRMMAEVAVPSPIAGTVTQRQVGVGQYIQSGASNPQFTIGDFSKVWLIANVREVDAPAIQLDQPVDVRVLAVPDRHFDAKINYIAASVDPTTRRVTVHAEIDNPDGILKPEMFARFTIVTGGETVAPGVPEAALIYEGDTARLWVARDDHTIELRQVVTGRSADGLVEIVSGLTAGEKIVTSGALFIDRAATPD